MSSIETEATTPIENHYPITKNEGEPLVEVEGAGLVRASETTKLPLDLLHPVPGQRHNLPASHEVVQHEIQVARELGSKALH